MTDRELFKLGFLHCCAVDGLTLPEMEKCAEDLLQLVQQQPQQIKTALVGEAYGGAKTLLSDLAAAPAAALGLGGLGLKAFLLGPMTAGAVVGGGIGAGLGHMRGLSDEDVDEEKMRELTDAYQSAAQKMRQRANAAPIDQIQSPAIRSLI